METVLYIVHILVCIGMLPVILLQSGKGGGVSAVFGGGGAGTVFGSRGASTFLTRATTFCAVTFMCTSLGLSYISSKSRSVIPDAPPAAAATGSDTPADDADQATAPGSGADTNTSTTE